MTIGVCVVPNPGYQLATANAELAGIEHRRKSETFRQDALRANEDLSRVKKDVFGASTRSAPIDLTSPVARQRLRSPARPPAHHRAPWAGLSGRPPSSRQSRWRGGRLHRGSRPP